MLFLQAFHLLPPEQDIRIIYVKLNSEVLEALRADRAGKAILSLDPEKDGVHSGEEIRIGEKAWKFEYKRENDLLDCISKDSRYQGIYNTIGTIKNKLAVKGELTGKVKDKIKKKSEESVQQKRIR